MLRVPAINLCSPQLEEDGGVVWSATSADFFPNKAEYAGPN